MEETATSIVDSPPTAEVPNRMDLEAGEARVIGDAVHDVEVIFFFVFLVLPRRRRRPGGRRRLRRG
jgi:hypothetical protein